MKKGIVSNVFASTVQMVINQLSGIFAFFLLSKYFTKNDFGKINWALSVLMIVFALLGFGIDQILVRKTAIENRTPSMFKPYLFHVVFTSILFIFILLLLKFSGLYAYQELNILAILAIGQAMIFITLPFKQIANGLERFRLLLFMSISANVIKTLGLLLLLFLGNISIISFTWLYLFASAIELIVSFYMGVKYLNLQLNISTNWKDYKALIKESLPQLGVIICTSGIARIDWILLGILSTIPILAEYSFAYKSFELSTLPLLIIAPLLLPKITKMFDGKYNKTQLEKSDLLLVLAKYEIIFACFISLILNIIWEPLINNITHNQYGSVNNNTILILSLCVPFLYINNILWTINFAKGRTKFILIVFIITLTTTCLGNLLLIPFFKAEGAATAYLIAIVVQSIHFAIYTPIKGIEKNIFNVLLSITCAFAAGLLAKSNFTNTYLQLVLTATIFIFLIFLTGQLKANEWHILKKWTIA